MNTSFLKTSFYWEGKIRDAPSLLLPTPSIHTHLPSSNINPVHRMYRPPLTAHINFSDSLCFLPFILKIKMCFFIKAHDRTKCGTLSNPSPPRHSAPSEHEVAFESHSARHVNISISTCSVVSKYD